MSAPPRPASRAWPSQLGRPPIRVSWAADSLATAVSTARRRRPMGLPPLLDLFADTPSSSKALRQLWVAHRLLLARLLPCLRVQLRAASVRQSTSPRGHRTWRSRHHASEKQVQLLKSMRRPSGCQLSRTRTHATTPAPREPCSSSAEQRRNHCNHLLLHLRWSKKSEHDAAGSTCIHTEHRKAGTTCSRQIRQH